MKLKPNRFEASDTALGDDSLNPMDGVANLADVMLVFACGLMLAIVIHWNIQLVPETDAPQEPSSSMTEVEEMPGGENSEINADGYAEVGKVYYDAETGKYYMVVDGDPAADNGELQQPAAD